MCALKRNKIYYTHIAAMMTCAAAVCTSVSLPMAHAMNRQLRCSLVDWVPDEWNVLRHDVSTNCRRLWDITKYEAILCNTAYKYNYRRTAIRKSPWFRFLTRNLNTRVTRIGRIKTILLKALSTVDARVTVVPAPTVRPSVSASVITPHDWL